MGTVNDEKYIVFRREEFFQMMGQLALPPYQDPHTGDQVGGDWDCAPIADNIQSTADIISLRDAVVIRRQDYLAAPALATYADCIGLVSKTTEDEELQKRLLAVADYFHQQAQLAAEEGHKWPD